MASRKRKVADFPEEMLQAWTLATQGKLWIEFESEGKARNFRQQLHMFRKAWMTENGPGSCQQWFGVDLIIDPRGDKFTVTTGKLDWKKQVQEQAEKAGMPHTSALPSAKIEHPSPIIPPGIVGNEIPDEVESTPVEDALAKGLEKLGFTSKS
jgi:hypothetical protein